MRSFTERPAVYARFFVNAMLFFSPLLALLAIAVESDVDWNITALAVNAGLYYLMAFVALATHELGHAIAGLCLGFDLVSVTVGVGGVGKAFRVGDSTILVHSFPWLGLTRAIARSNNVLTPRLALFFAAGPLASVLMLMCSTTASAGFKFLLLTQAAAPLDAFVLANCVILLGSVLPFPTGGMSSDSLQLLTLPFRSRKIALGTNEARAHLPGARLMERGKLAEAVAAFETALLEHPESVLIRHDLAAAVLLTHQWERARHLFCALISDPQTPKAFYALAHNNLAWASLHVVGLKAIEQADLSSATAIRLLPAAPPVRGTRGTVLVAMGRAAEGRDYLMLAFRGQTDRQSRALNAAWIAVAHARLGDSGASSEWFARARSLDPMCGEIAYCERLANSSPGPGQLAQL